MMNMSSGERGDCDGGDDDARDDGEMAAMMRGIMA